MNPKFYRKQISETGIEDMEIDVSSLQNAMHTIQKLDEMEHLLKQIKFNLHTDIRNVRVDYMRKMQEIDELSHKSGLFGRKPSVEEIFQKKKSLMKERKMDIKAYEIIENMTNHYLSEIEESRIYIRNHIQKKVR